ncbi:MAG: D-sedoheptulose 7-phosphate isomerase [candidate division Zixibacteria bacterium]|nr:D-sedoheptulose 7-phosphate isomerase [candidate division Zixibacteria bacterium]
MTKNTKQLLTVRSQIEESIALKEKVKSELSQKIVKLAEILTGCLKKGNKIFLCGNGGSAADAQHIAGELVVRLKPTSRRKALPAIALTVNSSILTAAANDFGFDKIFSRQVEALGKKGDCLLALSTSGESPNVNQAVKTARKMGLKTLALSGKRGGEMHRIADFSIIVPSFETQRIQEVHILIGHIVCDLVEKDMSKTYLKNK